MNAQKIDSDLYKCKVSNILGYDSADTQLNVVELPYFTVSPPAKLERFTIQKLILQSNITPWEIRNHKSRG